MDDLKFKAVNGIDVVDLQDTLDGLTLSVTLEDSKLEANHVVDVWANGTFSAGDKAIIIAAVEGLGAVHFDTYVTNRLNDVDARTAELIGNGLTYEVSIGVFKDFSLSDNAQKNLNGIRGNFTGNVELTQELNSLTRTAAYAAVEPNVFPVEISTMDGNKHEFTTYEAFMGLHNAAFSTVKGHYESGQDLRIQLLAVTYGDFAGIDAIVDNR
jgi:hypothetical protein